MNPFSSFFDTSSPRGQNRLAWLIVILFIAFVSVVAQEKSLMADEAKHFKYGINILNGDSDRFDDSKMPVSALNALPAKLASFLPDSQLKIYFEKIFVARFVTVLFSAFAAYMVFHWSRKLYGFISALVSLTLYVLDPNLIAHSEFVATDIPMVAMMLFSCYWLWRFANSTSDLTGFMARQINQGSRESEAGWSVKPSWKPVRSKDFWIFAIVLGLSQLTKYTAVSLYPLSFLALFIHDLPAFRVQDRKANFAYAKRFAVWFLVAIFIGLVIINIGFLFNRTFTTLGDYEFRSARFQSLQATLPFLHNIPVPVPYPYLEGLDWIIQREATGFGYGNLYLLGQIHPVKGFAGYYMIASLLKVPIATQIVIWASLAVYFRDKKRRQNILRDEIFLLLPVLFYTIYFNFFYNAQLGIRFYLIVFPLLYVFAGNLFVKWKELSSRQKMSVYALGVYLLISVLSYFPNYIPYFNEFIWDRRMAYKYLADSNIDWEQSKEYLKKYQAEHPEAIISPQYKITSGLIVVDANDLVGVTVKPEMYQWLRENFEPVDTVAYSYLVYKITPKQIEHLCATTEYCR
jgi:4-amino-4-deoxy-L-arabinose transferase-like glycosyltransferase